MAQIKSIYGNEIVDDALRGSMADEYSASSTYAVGDMVLKDGQLYECNTAITTAEAWTAAHWTAVTVGSELSDLKEDFINSLITDTATGAIASFPDGADNVPVKDLTVNIEPVQSGSGDPSPTNIRPISGWTEAVVTRVGKNLVKDSLINGQIGSNGGFADSTNRITNVDRGTAMPQTYLPAGTYTLSASGLDYATVLTKDSSNNIIDNFANSWNSLPFTFTLTKSAYVLFTLRKSDNSNLTSSDYSAQIEVGSTATTYEPYNGQTYTIDLDGTIYGGTLNVTTGVLTVDRIVTTIDENASINMASSQRAYVTCNDAIRKTSYGTDDIICNRLPTVSSHNVPSANTDTIGISLFAGSGYSGENWIYFSDGESTTVQQTKTWLASNPLTVVYRLATPFTVTLTAQQVTTLLGQNNVWADTGNTTVEYRADTKLYIDKVIATLS